MRATLQVSRQLLEAATTEMNAAQQASSRLQAAEVQD